MYTFQNDKVRLRAAERDDVDDFIRWFNDPTMQRFLGQAVRPMSDAEEQAWLDRTLNGEHEGYSFQIDAIDQAEPIHIGGCALFRMDWRNASAEVGIQIGEHDYWNKGYGSAAHRLLLEFGFGELNLHRIYLRVYDFNERGLGSYRKLGYRHEATMRQMLYREGKYHNIHYMGMLKREWEERYVHLPER
jgi:RimJ/RimL family protein N-acetyltransferase